MTFTIEWQPGHSIVAFSGEIRIRDIEWANKDFHGDNRLYKTSASIWDFSQCTSVDLAPSQLKYTVAVDIGSAETLPNFKYAFVSSNPEIKQLINYYIAACRKAGLSWQFEIFSNRIAALDWCKLGESQVLEPDSSIAI